jgi:hypothetical protein
MLSRTFANARAFAERSHNCHTIPGNSDKCARVCELSGPAPRRSHVGEPHEGSASFRRVHAFVRDVQ